MKDDNEVNNEIKRILWIISMKIKLQKKANEREKKNVKRKKKT